MIAHLPSNLQEKDTHSEARPRGGCDLAAACSRSWAQACLVDVLRPLFEVSPSLAAFVGRCGTWLCPWMKEA
jgi:hypothetical protein